ncbi:MAG TPA: methionine biosynthesis protein MetW, partial [Thiotrichales bacterium]|nr:methionine biosynthesis protein MetW [Thiotrichales bacterium]
MSLKPEFTRLLDWIPAGARVLDLGCGSADLL